MLISVNDEEQDSGLLDHARRLIYRFRRRRLCWTEAVSATLKRFGFSGLDAMTFPRGRRISAREIRRLCQQRRCPFHTLSSGTGSIGDNAARGNLGKYLREYLLYGQNPRGIDEELSLF